MPQAWPGHIVHRTSSTPAYEIDGKRSRASTLVGQVVCQSGIVSGFICGTIRNLDYRSENETTGVDLNHQIVVDYIPAVGDSGGAVFTNAPTALAVGIQSSKRDLNDYAVVSHIAELPTAQDQTTGDTFDVNVCLSADFVFQCLGVDQASATSGM